MIVGNALQMSTWWTYKKYNCNTIALRSGMVMYLLELSSKILGGGDTGMTNRSVVTTLL